MRNQTNIAYINGSNASEMIYQQGAGIVVSYKQAAQVIPASQSLQEASSLKKNLRLSEKTKRELKGAECALTKTQYILGSLFMLSGGLLTIFLERLL